MQKTFQQALQYHQAGRLSEAVSLYRQLLASEPENAQVLHLLGLAAYQQGDPALAIIEISKAINIDSNQPDYLSNLGLAFYANHQPQQALDAYNKALKLSPNDALIHNNLGSAQHCLRLLNEAEASYRKSLTLEPNNPSAFFNLGNLLSEKGHHHEAIQHYRQALKWTPQDADIHNNLANALRESGCFEDALVSYHETLRFRPQYPEAARHIGWLLQELGRPAEAISWYRQAIQQAPNDEIAHFNLGNALREVGQFSEAVTSYQAAIQLNSSDAELFNNLGNTLRELGQLQQAIDCYRRALHISPNLHHAKVHLLHQCQHACDWGELDKQVHEVRRLVREVPEALVAPFAFLAAPGVSAEEQRHCAENWVAMQYAKYTPLRKRLNFCFEHIKKPKIRLGYLSADFHEHATAYLMAGVFELHDRAHFEVFAYSYGPDDSSLMRSRLKKGFCCFNDVRTRNVEQIAKAIYDDGIDILIDLKGYTAHNRSEILALRPAPIQVNYLGYPGSMGANFIDYLIGDSIVTPPEHAPYYSETLITLPYCYQPNDLFRPAPDKPGRSACGLPEHGFVFCGFNQSFKIVPEVFNIWMQLLKEIPGSVLWLLQANNPLTTKNLKREAEARGIPAERLIFAPRLPLREHLARQQHADLLLDTLPYNAHTTASDALWMGVPIVTCMGDTFASRVSASLLKAVGLPQLITTSLNEYASLALELANHPEKLDELKEHLATHKATAPLFDTVVFTRHLEACYQTMWEKYLRN